MGKQTRNVGTDATKLAAPAAVSPEGEQGEQGEHGEHGQTVQQVEPGDAAREMAAAENRRAARAKKPLRQRADFCPQCAPPRENQANTKVYHTRGEVQFCVCNNCGATWQQLRPMENHDRSDR